MAGIEVTAWGHVGIRIHDLDRSRAFYEMLGFEFVVGPVGPEPVAILRHPCGIEVNLIINAPEADTPNVLMDVPVKKPGITHLAIEVRSLEGVQESLDEAGIRVTEGPVDFGTGYWGLFCRDPDGNVIEFDEWRGEGPR